MLILQVLTQYGKLSLNRPFSYAYSGSKKVGTRFRVSVPFNNRPIMGFVISISETTKSLDELEKLNGYRLNEVIDVIDQEPLLSDELMDLASSCAEYYMSPLINVLQSMLPKSLSPRLSSLKGPKIAYEKWVSILSNDETGCSDKQIEVLRLVSKNKEVLRKEAGSISVVETLIRKGKLRVFLKEKTRYVIPEEEREVPHEMSNDQRKAFEDILGSKQNVVLLEGVTGSGKTEVYLRLSEYYLNQRKNVLMLVPEISLTPIMVEYFSRRFGSIVAILHSGLTQGQKYDEYRRIARGEARVVVGARSAVFAPLSDIGLIVIDEEHVESYKQESAPYYHAREVAIMRGEKIGAKVVLGSATPSFETRARAGRGVYGIAKLENRINDLGLPETSIIDLREKGVFSKKSRIFSQVLIDKIQEKLEKKEQIILLINRRGYSSYVACRTCGHAFVCPNCGGNLSYHNEDGLLKCHHCDYVVSYPTRCPKCGSQSIGRIGFGTEKIMKEVETIFPEAKAIRVDSDVGKISGNADKALLAFRKGEADILVGTQMIAKGHDFPNVTLVGDVLADIGLNLPSYRASERTFELITQVVGRAGRAEKEGEAIIQTYNPGHYAIVFGADQNYEGFYRREMQMRKISKYPPYSYLLLISFISKNETRANEAALIFKEDLLKMELEATSIIGPSSPYYSLLGDLKKKTLLIKFREREEIVKIVASMTQKRSGRGGVDIDVEVDPLDY